MTSTAAPQVPSFDALRFRIDDKGQIDFDGTVFMKFRPALTGMFPSDFDVQPIDLIIVWYLLHQAQGGALNADLDALLQEVDIEHSRGQGFSLPEGRA